MSDDFHPIALDQRHEVTDLDVFDEDDIDDLDDVGRFAALMPVQELMNPARRPSLLAATLRPQHPFPSDTGYRDFASLSTSELEDLFPSPKTRGGVVRPFPVRLYIMLEASMSQHFEDVVGWLPHGRAFLIHNRDRFVNEILIKFFKQTKFQSFQRQLNLYGFIRLASEGPDQGAYYHELCLRGIAPPVTSISRASAVMAARQRAAAFDKAADKEPNFYAMPWVQGNNICRSSSSEDPKQSRIVTDAGAATVAVSPASVPSVGRRGMEPLHGDKIALQLPSLDTDGMFAIMPPQYTQRLSSNQLPVLDVQDRRRLSATHTTTVTRRAVSLASSAINEVTFDNKKYESFDSAELSLCDIDLKFIDPEARELTELGCDDQLPLLMWG